MDCLQGISQEKENVIMKKGYIDTEKE